MNRYIAGRPNLAGIHVLGLILARDITEAGLIAWRRFQCGALHWERATERQRMRAIELTEVTNERGTK